MVKKLKDVTNVKVCVLGLGYIGLPTASLLGTKGFQVHGVDICENAVRSINSGNAHIVEPDLDILVKTAVNSGNLSAHLKPAPADVFVIAVPTPFKEGFEPDLSYVEAAVTSLAPFLEDGNLILLESTSPVGTTKFVEEKIRKLRQDLQSVHVVYCPERVLPGAVLRELIENDRIVGGTTLESGQIAKEFYSTFVKGEVFVTNSQTAELVKLSENSYRDVNIAFANELSRVAHDLDVNVWELIQLANRHPRVNILRPGVGVGGHCIAVDPWFIVHSSPNQAKLIEKSRIINDSQPSFVLEQLKPKIQAAESQLRPIALLGLSFKPDIDDLRESPAIEVLKLVSKNFSGRIQVVEPFIDELPKNVVEFMPNVQLVNLSQLAPETHFVSVLVNHSVFKDSKEELQARFDLIDFVGLDR